MCHSILVLRLINNEDRMTEVALIATPRTHHYMDCASGDDIQRSDTLSVEQERYSAKKKYKNKSKREREREREGERESIR